MAHDIRDIGRVALVTTDVLAGVSAAGLAVAFYLAPGEFGAYDPETGTVSLVLADSAAVEITFLIAVLLLAANLLYLVKGRRQARQLHHVQSEADGGVVKVSREALEAGLRASGEAVGDVSRLRVAVGYGGPKRVVVHAHFHAPEGAPILQVAEALREVLRDRYAHMVRSAEGVKTEFDIEFVGFSGKRTRKLEVVDAEPLPFTGPKYPIPEEGGAGERAHDG